MTEKLRMILYANFERKLKQNTLDPFVKAKKKFSIDFKERKNVGIIVEAFPDV